LGLAQSFLSNFSDAILKNKNLQDCMQEFYT
jgi:hypothetical protein